MSSSDGPATHWGSRALRLSCNGPMQLLTLCLVVVIVLCAASLLVRFRRAQGIERQQLKWFSYAIALFALVFVAYLLTTLLWGEWLSNTASDVVFAIGYGLIPISAGLPSFATASMTSTGSSIGASSMACSPPSLEASMSA